VAYQKRGQIVQAGKKTVIHLQYNGAIYYLKHISDVKDIWHLYVMLTA